MIVTLRVTVEWPEAYEREVLLEGQVATGTRQVLDLAVEDGPGTLREVYLAMATLMGEMDGLVERGVLPGAAVMGEEVGP